jgi:tRNA pseudouridine38-40 synthase
VTLRIDLAYDGTDFRGWARQPGQRTVQGALEDALTRLVGPVETVVAGRTDAGVHARHQVVSFEADAEAAALEASLRRMLPPSVAVHRVIDEADGFSARFHAETRAYRYHLDTRPAADPFRARFAWHVTQPLDVDAMNRAAADLVGEQDFASFCRRAEGRTTVRRVVSAAWTETDGGLVFDVVGSAFCHQQVRSFVAYLVEVGRGRLPADGTPEVLAARDRVAARGAAPARGLTLWLVAYPAGFAEPPDLP